MVVALHSLQFRVHTRVLLTLLIACAIAGAMWAETPTRLLLKEATAAQKAGQPDVAREKLQAALALRPDYPRIHLQLARLHAAQGYPAAALSELATLADFGLALELTRDSAFDSLPRDETWATLLRRFAANGKPQGQPAVAVTIPASDGIIESAVRDSHGRWFLADVRNRTIFVRETDGRLHEFSQASDGLVGVFSLLLDEGKNRLWASVSSVPEIKNFTADGKYVAALVEYELSTGEKLRTISVPPSASTCVLGSIARSPDGSIFASDSAAPKIWRVADDGSRLEVWLESTEFASLQGLAFSADGHSLYIADYANGIWRIDTATKHARLQEAPPGTTLFGIDDLRLVQGALVGVQNGLNPQRVIRLSLDAAGDVRTVTVLAAGHPAMSDLTGGYFADGSFHFIGNSGWSLYEQPQSPPAPRDIVVLALPL